MGGTMQSGVVEDLLLFLLLPRRPQRLQHPLQAIQEHVMRKMEVSVDLDVVMLAMLIAIVGVAIPNLAACQKISASECAMAATMRNGAALRQHHHHQRPQLHRLRLRLYGRQLAISCSAMGKMLCCMGSEPHAPNTWRVVSV